MPQFSIEAEGEAAPLNENLVYQTLAKASGSNPQQVTAATRQLSRWESQPGYYLALSTVYANWNHHQHIRFQAIVQLKNGVDKYWRKTSNVISKEEKMKIRTQTLNVGIQESSWQLAIQNALVFSKIVRHEFPHEWPEVISHLVQCLRSLSNRPDDLQGTLLLILYVIKELATARLQRSRQSLMQAAPELLQALADIYDRSSREWMALLDDDIEEQTISANAMRICLTALRAIRRLVIVGFDHPRQDTTVERLWHTAHVHFSKLWPRLLSEQSSTADPAKGDLMARHLLQVAKLHLEMARHHPAQFVLLPNSVKLLREYWDLIQVVGHGYTRERGAQDWQQWEVYEQGELLDEMTLSEKLVLKGLLLYRACLNMAFHPVRTFKYQQPKDKEERQQSVNLVKVELLTTTFVAEMVEILITMFFALRTIDLREWQEEPTEWERREEGVSETWEVSARACAEKLYLDLLINYKDSLIPKLLQVFHRYASTENREIFLKDALYNAIGLAAAILHSHLDFNSFLAGSLLSEIQVHGPAYNIIRRRTALLLGQWTPVIPDSIQRPLVYQIFALLLSPSDLNDLVVRVTAGRQLKPVLEPFDFSYQDFAPSATAIFTNLMRLIQEVELVETKMALLSTIRVAVERMEAHIAPFSDEIVGLLPSLWEQSGNEYLMKQAILTLISSVIEALKHMSLRYHSLILPLIRDSIQPDSDARTYLLEEALDLWLAVVRNSPSSDPPPSPALLSLSQCLFPLLELGSDALRQVFEILESYILLSPTNVLSLAYLNPLLSSLNQFIASNGDEPTFPRRGVTRREIERVSAPLITLLTALPVPRHFPNLDTRLEAGRHLVAQAIETSFLSNLLTILKEAHEYHRDPQPSRDVPSVIGPAETDLFSVLSRLAILSPYLLVEGLIAAQGPSTPSWVVEEWTTHFETIGDVYQKKLQSLAMTSLYTISCPPPTFMLEQLQALMTVWTDMITELGEDASDNTEGDYLFQPSHAEETSDPQDPLLLGPEADRKREIERLDPVYCRNLRTLVGQTMQTVVTSVGGPEVFQHTWLNRVDPAVVQAFANLGLM